MGAVDELFAFAFPLGESYSGAWADASTFEVAVVVPHYNQSAEASPQVGVSNASFAGGAPLYNLNAELPVSSTEAPLLSGDPALLMAPEDFYAYRLKPSRASAPTTASSAASSAAPTSARRSRSPRPSSGSTQSRCAR